MAPPKFWPKEVPTLGLKLVLAVLNVIPVPVEPNIFLFALKLPKLLPPDTFPNILLVPDVPPTPVPVNPVVAVVVLLGVVNVPMGVLPVVPDNVPNILVNLF